MNKFQSRRINVSMPQNLLEEVDGLLQRENCSLSDLIIKATSQYILEANRIKVRETMQKGYLEMAMINLSISCESFEAEEEALRYTFLNHSTVMSGV